MKPYSQMTPAERIADRIAKNRAMEQKAKAPVLSAKRTYTPAELVAQLTPAQIAAAQARIASGEPIRKVVEVRCWNRTILLLPSHVDAIKATVSGLIAKYEEAKAKGYSWMARTKGVSVSTVISEVRDQTRVNFPTNHGEAHNILEALGYQLERLDDNHTTVVREAK